MYKIDRRGGHGGVQKSYTRNIPTISGKNAAARTGYRGPGAAARSYYRAGRFGHMTNYIHVLHTRSEIHPYSMYKIDRRGGPKIALQEITP